MLDDFGLDWMAQVRNAFLIRDPAAVLASYVQKRGDVNLADIGVARQRELFEREADRLGAAPPVVEGADVLADPPQTLARLCQALSIDYTDAMLSWPRGRRATDGVWAPAWYNAVEQSTGFGPPPRAPRRSIAGRVAARSGRSAPALRGARRRIDCADSQCVARCQDRAVVRGPEAHANERR